MLGTGKASCSVKGQLWRLLVHSELFEESDLYEPSLVPVPERIELSPVPSPLFFFPFVQRRISFSNRSKRSSSVKSRSSSGQGISGEVEPPNLRIESTVVGCACQANVTLFEPKALVKVQALQEPGPSLC